MKRPQKLRVQSTQRQAAHKTTFIGLITFTISSNAQTAPTESLFFPCGGRFNARMHKKRLHDPAVVCLGK